MWFESIGQRFGKLTVISYVGKTDDGKDDVLKCQCDCGEEITARLKILKQKGVTQCKLCRYKNTVNHFQTHGLSNTRIYDLWQGIKNRCYKHSAQSYARYGARGITMCDEWKNDFTAFYKWAMLNGYSDELEIDRIDNDGNYCPDNCRWATHKEQANNRRTNVFITYQDKTLTLQQWAEEKGINESTLYSRIKRNGWSLDRALNIPSRRYAE